MHKTKIMIISFIVVIVFLSVIVGIVSIVHNKQENKEKARQIAENYLMKKYGTKMTFSHVNPLFIEGGYWVYFKNPQKPKISFAVNVPSNFDREYVTDNYLEEYFSTIVSQNLQLEWGGDASIFLVIEGDGRHMKVPRPIIKNKEIDEMDDFFRYAICVRTEEFYDNISVDLESERIFAFIQTVKEKGYSPHELSFSYKKGGEPFYLDIDSWNQIKNIDEVEEIIRSEGLV